MNKNLHKPKSNARDEFYTLPETAAGLFHFVNASEFNGKTVYCNCDGKINYDDYTHRLEVQYIRNIPIDYTGEMLVPMSICCLKSLRDQYDILGLADKCAVNGKNRFYRIIIKRKIIA